ncbi:trichothecene efflux pump [Mytilinidion resinicola]|uniref:Trichothecene efflux pump n=1 Tax=Mytilinidion resinicola TaxID=574789 RepID=A0A6A6Z6M0_9PEZI|nr:trichothecene efflux pump [Mytilinidion resinicola]KAF2815944.1 trichothecene efflux pump [Mytilinidion resinicola]
MSDNSLSNEKGDISTTERVDNNLRVRTEDEEYKFTFGKFLAVLSFQQGYMADVFVIIMSSTILLDINRDIGPNPNYTWVAITPTLGAAVVSPLVGRMSDIFGRRNFLLVGNLLGLIGCAIAATAHNINVIIGGSVLIGIGSGLHQTAWACLAEVVPKRARSVASGFFESTLALAQAFGPVIATVFVKHASWRAIYWLPFAMNCFAGALVFFFYHPVNQYIREEGKTVWQQAVALDWVGTFLLVSGLVLFLLGITFGGSQFPWVSAGTLAPLIIGFVLLVILGFYEAYADITYPIFPPAIFKLIRGFTVVLVSVFLVGMIYYATAVLWAEQAGVIFTTDPLKVGWYAGAVGMGGLLFGSPCGYIFKAVGHARILVTIAVGAMALCCGLQAIVTPGSHIASTILVVLIGGFLSAANVFQVTIVQLTVAHEYIGVASALITTARSVGGSVATAIYTSILKNKLVAFIPKYLALPLALAGVAPVSLPAVIGALTTGTGLEALATLTPQQLEVGVYGLKESYAHAFRVVYLVTIAFGVLGTIAVCFTANVGHLMTRKVDIRLEEGAHLHGAVDTGEGHVIHHGEKV